MEISGWSYVENSDAEESKTYVVLKGKDTTLVYPTALMIRKDITKALNKKLDKSGYHLLLFKKYLVKDNFQIGIFITKGQTHALKYIGKTLNLKEFEPAITHIQVPEPSNDIQVSIDALEDTNTFFKLKGWCHIKGLGSEDSRTYIVLRSDTQQYIFDTSVENRADVSAALTPLNLDSSGFTAKISKATLSQGTYKIGLIIIKGKDQKAFQFINKEIKISR